jgi:ribosome assembly protein 1
VDVSNHGDLILGCCGEVHLEKCINDLENVYAKVPIQGTLSLYGYLVFIIHVVSDPLVFLRETLYGDNNLKYSKSPQSSRLHPSSLLTPFPPWNNDKNNQIKIDPSTFTTQQMSLNSLCSEGILQGTNLLFRVSAQPLPGQGKF